MFNSLFGKSSYNYYNVKLANLFGLEAAVYLSTVLSFDEPNIASGGYITLNRDAIKNITTLTVDTQRNFDNLFTKIAVFEFKSKDEVKLNYSSLLSLFNSEYEDVVLDMAPKLIKKRTKSDAIKDELKILIKTDNGELRDAYVSWIDSVFSKQGWMSKKSVELGQQLIDRYSNRNLDIAIELLNIASIGGYRDIQWAINSYEENNKHKVLASDTNMVFEPKKTIELAQEVF